MHSPIFFFSHLLFSLRLPHQIPWPKINQNNSIHILHLSFLSFSLSLFFSSYLKSMIPSYCFSSTRNTTSSLAFLLQNHHLLLPKYHSSSLSRETHLLKKETSFLKPQALPPKFSFPILRPKNSNFTHPFASISSFAEAEGEEKQNEAIKVNDEKTEEGQNDYLPGMAQSFRISSRTASAISIFIAFAALSLPLFMSSLGQGLPLKTKLLSYATLLFGFYMAWNIGANDVANAMGTSVGSGALTLRQAVLTAAVLEFSGAMLMGTHVTSTMQKGILVANVFQGNNNLLFAGLLSSLAAAGTWLQVQDCCGFSSCFLTSSNFFLWSILYVCSTL